jgi:hypothetical protein
MSSLRVRACVKSSTRRSLTITPLTATANLPFDYVMRIAVQIIRPSARAINHLYFRVSRVRLFKRTGSLE